MFRQRSFELETVTICQDCRTRGEGEGDLLLARAAGRPNLAIVVHGEGESCCLVTSSMHAVSSYVNMIEGEDETLADATAWCPCEFS